MMIRVWCILGIFFSWVGIASADTIDRYMNIALNIPKMEMKADPESQAWARSARNIISLTNESIAETLVLANAALSQHNDALFCLPEGTQLTPQLLTHIIEKTYQSLSSMDDVASTMTVSQVALMGLTKKYPCSARAMRRVTTTAANHPRSIPRNFSHREAEG